MENRTSRRFRKAKKRVEHIKRFYRHLAVYLVINTVLFIAKIKIFGFFTTKGFENQGFFDWLEWNIIATPVFWGIGLFFHGLYVFKFKSKALKELKPKFLRDWEEKQLQKYMEE